MYSGIFRKSHACPGQDICKEKKSEKSLSFHLVLISKLEASLAKVLKEKPSTEPNCKDWARWFFFLSFPSPSHPFLFLSLSLSLLFILFIFWLLTFKDICQNTSSTQAKEQRLQLPQIIRKSLQQIFQKPLNRLLQPQQQQKSKPQGKRRI